MKILIFLSLFLTHFGYADELSSKDKIINVITCPQSGVKVSSFAGLARCPEYLKKTPKEQRPLVKVEKMPRKWREFINTELSTENEITCPQSGVKVSSFAGLARCPEYLKKTTKKKRSLLGERSLMNFSTTSEYRYLCSSGKVTFQVSDCNGNVKARMHQC